MMTNTMLDGEKLCCHICGKELTEASGLWNLLFRYHGVADKDKHDEGVRCCPQCKEEVTKAMGKLIKKHNREKWFSWG